MQKIKIVDLTVNDNIESRKIYNGDFSGIIQLNNIKYPWAVSLYNTMKVTNYWIPESYDLTDENLAYSKLTVDEQRCYRLSLSFLTFLDSAQVTNLPNISLHLTAPELKLVLSEHISQEALHSKTYQYIAESTLPSEEINEVFDLYKTDPNLRKRSESISKIYQDHIEDPYDENKFLLVLMANFILEGLYFYLTFTFFFTLRKAHKLNGVVAQIDHIKTDEETHIAVFQNILLEIGINKRKELQAMWYDLLDNAVNQEIEWSNYCFKNVSGFNSTSIEKYIKWRANLLTRKLRIPINYRGYDDNPYDTLIDVANFFEADVTNYGHEESYDWDDI